MSRRPRVAHVMILGALLGAGVLSGPVGCVDKTPPPLWPTPPPPPMSTPIGLPDPPPEPAPLAVADAPAPEPAPAPAAPGGLGPWQPDREPR